VTREKGVLPKAYLRISPDLDQHEDPLTMVRLMCLAHRQPERGRFRGEANVIRAIGRKRFNEAVTRGDLERDGLDRWYLVGWDEWQEGDFTVGERMRRMRARRNSVTPK
jgi:hypothetical protein